MATRALFGSSCSKRCKLLGGFGDLLSLVVGKSEVHAQITITRDELQCRGVLGDGFVVTPDGGESDTEIGARGDDFRMRA
jgi:hypothetical protein